MGEESAGCLGPDRIGSGNKYWHTQELERESWGVGGWGGKAVRVSETDEMAMM